MELQLSKAHDTLKFMLRGFWCGLLALAFLIPTQRSETLAFSYGSFDAPLHTKVVDFGPSPYYPNPRTAPRVRLSCYFFPNFMVKEYDEGQKGAAWLAIVLKGNDGVQPACTRSHSPDEVEIKWWGYFKASKAHLVFFSAADGLDGGMPFAVFDSRTGTKIFEDVGYESQFVNRRLNVAEFSSLRISGAPEGSISLKYLHVEAIDCDLSLKTRQSACWEMIRARAGIGSKQIPRCSGYERTRGEHPSAVAYPVEVFLVPRQATRTVAGPIRCWPRD